MKPVRVSHAVFAATLIFIGILGLIKADFAPIWEPVPKGLPAREALAYLCALVCLGCGMGLLLRRAAAAAARVLLAYLLLWLLLFKVRYIFLAPAVEVSYESCGETAVIVAGAWALYAGFVTDWDREFLGFASANSVLRSARVIYGLSLIAFGLSHFAYVEQTAGLVPVWLPSHVAWAYFTGCTYLAAGAALIIGMYARLASALSALQMGMFTLLVWGPVVVTGPDAAQWSEFVISWTLTVSAWVVADSLRRRSVPLAV